MQSFAVGFLKAQEELGADVSEAGRMQAESLLILERLRETSGSATRSIFSPSRTRGYGALPHHPQSHGQVSGSKYDDAS